MKKEGFSPVMNEWKKLSSTLGRKIQFSEIKGMTEGEAIDLADDGGLLIRSDSGDVVKRCQGM